MPDRIVPDRIVSLLPAATELIYKLGAQDRLAGVTHGCTWPPAARAKPRVTRPAFDPSALPSAGIDAEVRRLASAGGAVSVIDTEALARARPDVIVAQDACGVCAPGAGAAAAAAELLGDGPETYLMDPRTMGQILESVTGMGALLGLEERAAGIRRDLEAVIAAGAADGPRPRVLVLEWLDPPYAAGHWVPEMVEAAGGENLAGSAGRRSERIGTGGIARLDPDAVVLAPCGFGLARTVSEYRATLARDPAWRALRAVGSGRVHAVDAASYFSGPSIRTIAGIGVLRAILSPGAPPAPAGSTSAA